MEDLEKKHFGEPLNSVGIHFYKDFYKEHPNIITIYKDTESLKEKLGFISIIKLR